MKRNILIIMSIMFGVAVAKADIAPTVMLSHNGQRTMYMWDEVQKAVDAAVDGDTIYLSNGTFEPFNVTKRIMVRGTGAETIISGNCTVYIAGNTRISMPVLDALTFTGNVSVTSAYEQFTIRKCRMQNLSFSESDYRDVKLDRCDIQGTLHLTQNVKEFNCFNTKIKELRPYDHAHGVVYFDHCNIREITDTILATFNCCVLQHCKSTVGSKYGVCIGGCRLNYCIMPKYYSGNQYNNSYRIDTGTTFSYSQCFLYNPSVSFNNCYEVEINGASVVNYGSSSYLGDDGTMVGCYGGQHPFRLTPELPRVTNSSVEVDAANKKLNVKLTLSKE